MVCKPKCICKCDHSGCECWDGIGFAQLQREMSDKINTDLKETS